jgi:hypothetical protein
VRVFVRGRASALISAFAIALVITLSVASTRAHAFANQIAGTAPQESFDLFLDRLMAAESGGRSNAKNPRSTALGPYQFIKSTFLELTRRHFPAEIVGLTEEEILRLRTDPDLSRRAAAVFCRESLSYLRSEGLEPNFAHLRLAYLLGPADAARIMRADAETPVAHVLSAAVLKANPFMRGMSASDLIGKSERDVSRDGGEHLHATGGRGTVRQASTRFKVKSRQALNRVAPTQCKKSLASCRKFLAARTAGGA